MSMFFILMVLIVAVIASSCNIEGDIYKLIYNPQIIVILIGGILASPLGVELEGKWNALHALVERMTPVQAANGKFTAPRGPGAPRGPRKPPAPKAPPAPRIPPALK